MELNYNVWIPITFISIIALALIISIVMEIWDDSQKTIDDVAELIGQKADLIIADAPTCTEVDQKIKKYDLDLFNKVFSGRVLEQFKNKYIADFKFATMDRQLYLDRASKAYWRSMPPPRSWFRYDFPESDQNSKGEMTQTFYQHGVMTGRVMNHHRQVVSRLPQNSKEI